MNPHVLIYPTSPVLGVINLWSYCFFTTPTLFPFLYFEKEKNRDYIISSVFQHESLKDKHS